MWRIGSGIGRIAHRLAKKRRAIVLANLRIVYPELSHKEVHNLSKKVFRHCFANVASSINTGFISSKKIPSIISIHGQEHLKNLDPDKGCVFLLFHMGNWELLSRVSPLLETDKPSAAMFRPLNNPLINTHITKSREKDGTHLFGRKKGLIKASKFLRDGGTLGILSDQHAGKSGVQLPLFGKKTSITPLPAMLAQKYDCPIIPITLATITPGEWSAQLENPISIPQDLDKTAATASLIPIMEKIMKQNTVDIFWLHDLWKIKRTLKH